MPRLKQNAMNTPIARAIFGELELFAKDHHSYPTRHALFQWMTLPHYNPLLHQDEVARYPDLTIGAFRHWFGRLVEDGYIAVDYSTQAIRCVNLVVTELESAE